MPLDRAHVTVASRVMLPSYVVAFNWIGWNYLFTDHVRLVMSPTLAYVDHLIGLHTLGVLLIGAGFIMAAGIASEKRDEARYALIVAGICFGLLTALFFAATLRGGASPSAAAWPFLATAACIASYRSLSCREVS